MCHSTTILSPNACSYEGISCRIYLPGSPIAWKRAGRKRRGYFDQQLKEKTAIRWEMKKEWRKEPSKALIELSCKFTFPVPNSLSKAKRSLLLGNPANNRIDLDNALKFILDAGQGILWENDKQVVSFKDCGKFWGYEGSTILTFKELS